MSTVSWTLQGKVHTDSDAVLTHLNNFGARWAGRFMECFEPTAFAVFGEPDDRVRDALTGFAPRYLGSVAGFHR